LPTASTQSPTLRVSDSAKVIAGRALAEIFSHSQIGFGIGADDACRQGLAVFEGDLDFVCSLDHMMVGQDEAILTDDDPGTEVGCLARPFVETVTEEVAEYRVVERRVAVVRYFLLGEYVDDRRNDPLRGRRERFGQGDFAARSVGLIDGQVGQGLHAEDIRPEQGDDEQDAQCDGGRLGEQQPEFAHIQLKKQRLGQVFAGMIIAHGNKGIAALRSHIWVSGLPVRVLNWIECRFCLITFRSSTR
jgi:hypothetical protein